MMGEPDDWRDAFVLPGARCRPWSVSRGRMSFAAAGYSNSQPNFSLALRATSGLGVLAGGNLSRHL